MIIPEPGDPVYVDAHPELNGRIVDVQLESNGYVRILTDNLLDVVAATARDRCDRNWDAAVAIVGAEGSGKSTCAWALAKKFAGDGFDIRQSYAYDVPEFAESIMKIYDDKIHNRLKGRPVIWSDEGINILYGRNSMTKESKLITQVMAMMRSLGAMYIYCIPRAHDIDAMLRDARLWSLLDCTQQLWADPDEKVWGCGPEAKMRRGTFRWWARPPQGGEMVKGYWGLFPKMSDADDFVYQAMKLDAQGRKLGELVSTVVKTEESVSIPSPDEVDANTRMRVYDVKPGSKREKRREATEARNDRILAIREQKNLSYGEIASMLGMSKATVYDACREATARRERESGFLSPSDSE